MPGNISDRFEELHADGMNAKSQGNHADALVYFERADYLAQEHEDERKRLDALNPAARALWTLGNYREAHQRLMLARQIASKLELIDEEAIARSNLGRLAAIQVVNNYPLSLHPKYLTKTALLEFKNAYNLLENHPHLYYRYANATHGSVASALAGNRDFTRQLIAEGLAVAHQISPEPYDQRPPAEISPKGLKQLRAARYLIAMGSWTPVLAAKARRDYIY